MNEKILTPNCTLPSDSPIKPIDLWSFVKPLLVGLAVEVTIIQTLNRFFPQNVVVRAMRDCTYMFATMLVLATLAHLVILLVATLKKYPLDALRWVLWFSLAILLWHWRTIMSDANGNQKYLPLAGTAMFIFLDAKMIFKLKRDSEKIDDDVAIEKDFASVNAQVQEK
ncbi:hypothetical protein Cantr_05852 [Candida viswanathii]|uniref:Uncharacterized protein n=1 Tax=Candida viswanathii TaxID=5486 RepID=A0A367XSR2_9ASCO|nr:hypothetical protein Cantr_05852 [Candida viswanathii]